MPEEIEGSTVVLAHCSSSLLCDQGIIAMKVLTCFNFCHFVWLFGAEESY
jgi:hypothetical protein